MLVSFKVSNSRSIGEEVELSMLADPRVAHSRKNDPKTFEKILSALSTIENADKTTMKYVQDMIEQERDFSLYNDFKKDKHPQNLHYDKKYNLHIFKTVALYGANASGKTNILTALADFFTIINDGHIKTNGNGTSFYPNKNEKKYTEKPTFFEAKILIKDTLYLFGFRFNANAIVEEYLYQYENDENEKQLVYKRLYNMVAKRYEWEVNQEIATKLESTLHTHKQSLERNTLWLHRLLTIGENDATLAFGFVEDLKNCTIWPIINKNYPGQIDDDSTFWEMRSDKDFKKYLLKALKYTDFLITDMIAIPQLGSNIEVFFQHKNTDASFSLAEESNGTRTLLRLLYFWYRALKDGDIALFDELGNSMHPHLAAFLIKQIHQNTKTDTQLLFTTHYAELMSDDLMREDQIKIVDRDQNGNTILKSFSDFETLPDYARRESVYLQGVVGGTPYINDEPIKIKGGKNGK